AGGILAGQRRVGGARLGRPRLARHAFVRSRLTSADGVGTTPARSRARSDPMSTAVVVRRPVLPWWFFLVTGIAWLVFAWVILSLDYRTVWAVAIWTGFGLIGMGITTFFASSVLDGAWKWLG